MKGTRALLVFEGNKDLLKAAEEEYRLQLDASKVPARAFYETYMNLRSLLISIARTMENNTDLIFKPLSKQ